MKQVEKLDLLLKGLYETKKDDYCSLGLIVDEFKIPIETIDEFRRLAKRLENDRYISKPIINRNDISARLTSYGIDYCEGSSYSVKGSAIINNTYNISVENSENTNIINQSENIKIETKEEKLKFELENIIKIIISDDTIPENSQQKLIARINNSISNL